MLRNELMCNFLLSSCVKLSKRLIVLKKNKRTNYDFINNSYP